MPVLERVRESIKRDMQGVSKMDATCALAAILALPGIAWIIVAHWADFLAYVASL
jgi:hypothetical protein